MLTLMEHVRNIRNLTKMSYIQNLIKACVPIRNHTPAACVPIRNHTPPFFYVSHIRNLTPHPAHFATPQSSAHTTLMGFLGVTLLSPSPPHSRAETPERRYAQGSHPGLRSSEAQARAKAPQSQTRERGMAILRGALGTKRDSGSERVSL